MSPRNRREKEKPSPKPREQRIIADLSKEGEISELSNQQIKQLQLDHTVKSC
jgi:hypothetical protein